MKKLVTLYLVFLFFSTALMAQDDEEQRGFKKENLFAGGSITVSFFNSQTLLGANPFFGYKIANWLDAGVALNYVYSGTRDYYQYNDKVRQTVLGPGAFARLYPVSFLFAQCQFEHNFSKFKYVPPGGSPVETTTGDANSLLVGGGFAQGREKGSNTFYYICLLFDVMKNPESPYVNVTSNPSNPLEKRVDMIPIIRAGINVSLFSGRNK